MSAIEEVLQLTQALATLRETNKLDYYKPYPKQVEFHHAIGHKTQVLATQRALIAGNQVGKTYCAAVETAMHATGIYPDWWKGWRFTHPVEIMVGSATNETCRDICQRELFGEPTDEKKKGTGSVPLECIVSVTRKPGVPNAFDSARVAHASGGVSKIVFRAYEQGAKKHMGLRIHFGWLDEEPPMEIFSQYIRATLSTHGALILTFTPESGVTEVVYNFMSELRQGQTAVNMSWDDAGHFSDPEYRAQKLAEIPPHERELRSRGIPVMGSGLVFSVADEDIAIDPIQIPSHWPRINGVDFGSDHPFACTNLAFDRDTDTAYVYDVYRESRALMPVQAEAVKRSGTWIPIAWPHDGLQQDKQSGKPLADIYRDKYGLNMLPKCFSNPAAPGQKEGQGGQGVEVGLMAMITAMEEGRFKVFKTCEQWFEEKRIYHRKDGKIVKLRDDIMAATRYAYQSSRFAQTAPIRRVRQHSRRGLRNW